MKKAKPPGDVISFCLEPEILDEITNIASKFVSIK